jgi:glycosyltransferase involved in cell wall biosynthesis
LHNKVLILTYYWPPSGGAGVQRWLKFAKYLPEFGWEPVILTVDPENAAYPATDPSLAKEVSPGLVVYQTPATDYFAIYRKDRSMIPSGGFANNSDDSFKSKLLRFVRGNFFIPDPRKGWNRHAFKKACEIINTMGIRHIITTSPPHSTQLIGLKIKNKFPGIKWIADLRDPWTDIYYYRQFYPTFLSKAIDSGFERKVLENADKIITVGESLRELFRSKVKRSDNIEVVTNGFDENDFKINAIPGPSVFTITYVGTLSDIYQVEEFLNALSELKTKYILRFIGTVSGKQKDLIMAKLRDQEVEFIKYVDHGAAINYMCTSSALLLIIPDHQSNKSIITGKIFEYLASGKPIICLGPTDGDAASIVERTRHGMAFTYYDTRGISDYLSALTRQKSTINYPMPIEFSRRELTRKISLLLNNLNS